MWLGYGWVEAAGMREPEERRELSLRRGAHRDE
jgi:hypothetical protein